MIGLGILLVGGIASLTLTVVALIRPKHVWPLLVVASILGSGLMPNRLSVIDELLVGGVVFAALGALSIGFVGKGAWKLDRVARLHIFLFLLLSGYLVIQSFVGIAELGGLRKMRWVLFYGLLGLLPLVLRAGRFPIPSRRQTTLIITLGTLAYLLVYILHGISAEFLREQGWREIQRAEWGTTAYVLLPIAIAIPAIISLIGDQSRLYRRAGWITFATIIFAVVFYESRIGLVVVGAFCIMMFPGMGLNRSVKVLFAGVAGLLIFTSIPFLPGNRSITSVAQDLTTSGSAFFREPTSAARSRDLDRYFYTSVAFPSISGDWTRFLFGYGFRVNGTIISTELQKLYDDYFNERRFVVPDDVSVEAFTALVVDSGVVGLLLLVLNFLLVAYQIIREKANKYRYVLLTSLGSLFFWMFVINLLDILLFYVAIMPSGILVILARPDGSEIVEPSPAFGGAPHRKEGERAARTMHAGMREDRNQRR